MASFPQTPGSVPNRHEVRLNIAVRAAKVGLWEWDIASGATAFSAEWKRQLGYAADELRDDFAEWETRVHPEDLPRVKQLLEEFLADPWPDYEVEFRMRHRDGSWRWILAQADLIRGADGRPTHMVGSHIDITTHKRATLEVARANRALRMLSESNQSVIRAQNEPSLLYELCRVAVEVGGYGMAWIGFAEDDGEKLIRPTAHRGPLAGYGAMDGLSWSDGPAGDQPAGNAIRTAQTRVVHDIAAELPAGPPRETALKCGYRSLVALPLLAHGRAFGVFCIYSVDADAFDAREMEILHELAGDVAYGVTALRVRAERDRANAELQRQLLMIDAFFQQSVANFVLLDREFRYVRVNEAFAQFYGLKPGDFAGQPAHFLYGSPEAMPAEYWNMLHGVMQTRQPLRQFAAPYTAPPGVPRDVTYWDSTLQPILDASGEPEFLVFTAHEVTERVRVQDTLTAREQEFRTLAEHSPDFLARFDREHRYLYANPMLTELLQLPLADLLGRRPTEVYPNNPGAALYESWLSECFTTGVSGEHELTLALPGTEPPCHLIRFVPERDARGEITSILCIGRDITGLKQTERQLRTLTEHSPDLIARFDREGRFLFVNGVVEEITGLPAQEYLGKRVGDVMTERIYPAVPDELVALRQAITSVFATGSTLELEVRVPVPGAERIINVRLVPERDEHARVVTVLHVGRDVTQRRRTEEALRESQARLELANRATRIGPWDWNLLTNEVHFSAEWKRQLGYAEHEIGHDYAEWESRLHPDDRSRVLAQLQAYQAGKAPDYEIEFRLRHKDGSYRWIFTRAEILRDAAGRPWRMLGCHLDITSRKQAQEALRQSQQAYAALVNSVDGIVWELDAPTFRFTFVSQQAERLLGYRTTQWLAEPTFWLDHVHPEDRAWVHQFCREATARKRDHAFRYRMIAADGRTVWLHDIVTVVVENDRPAKLRGIMVDITDAQVAEEALRWRTALFEAQMDAALDGILIVDSSGKKILQNARMAELWQIPPAIADDPDDRPQVEFVTRRTKRPEQFSQKVAHLYAHPDEVSRDEIELVDGKVLDRYSAPVKDKAGKHYGRIWTFRDVTATRQLEEQLRQSQKMEAVGRLAGGIAHDFNNLLTVIQIQSSMLLDGTTPSEEVGSSIREIMDAAQRAAILTRQLLTFSRRQSKEARILDLGEVIGTMTKLVRRILGEDISLETRFAHSLPLVHADPGMMEQVLVNLLVNARDAMPEGGEIVLALDAVNITPDYVAAHAAARTGRFVRLSVSDTGSGIAPENLARIFEPFFTTKDVGKGTGLGLATVYGIVQQHQGWIEVESELGRGATFLIFLPAAEGARDAAATAEAAERASGGSETVLLVEDEAAVRALVVAALQRHGYRVIEAANGVEALQLWEGAGGKIDLLLTDLVMPGGVSGQKLADQLLTHHAALKIIFTSGYSDELAGGRRRFEVGRNFLPKPYLVSDLLAIVRQRLDDR